MRFLPAAIVLAALASDSGAQVLQDLTPAQVRAALADAHADGCYSLKYHACFTTPYSRVVALAANARELNNTATEADVTREIIAPGELHIHVFDDIWLGRGWRLARVQGAWLGPASNGARPAIEPTRTLTPGTLFIKDRTKSIVGKQYPELATANRSLVFPLSVLSEGNELHVVFDHPVKCGSWGFADDCASRLKTKKVK